MNRYKSSSKISSNPTNIILFEDDFDQHLEQEKQSKIYVNMSVPSKIQNQTNQETQKTQGINKKSSKRLEKIDQLMIVGNVESNQNIKLNNFFGSKKLLERKVQTLLEPNPQPRQRRETAQQDDTNEKLQKLVQKQIEERARWQQQKSSQRQQKPEKQFIEQSNPTNMHILQENESNPVLIINNLSNVQKSKSTRKLQKIHQQKFSSINIEKNLLFEHHTEQETEYFETIKHQQPKQQQSPPLKNKKRSSSQLKPLNKKPSTYQVLNQLGLTKDAQKNERSLQSMQSSGTKLFPTPSLRTNLEPGFAKNSKSGNTRIIGLDIDNFLKFNTEVIPRNKYIEGTLHRNKSCIVNSFFPQFRIQFDSVNVLSAKKTMIGYDIMLADSQKSQNNKSSKIGSVKGNFLGSYYNIYQGEQYQEIIATVFYASSFTSKSVARQLQLYVKKSEVKYSSLDRDNKNDGLIDLKTLYCQGNNKSEGKILKFINKQPHYDEVTKMYRLNFGGQVSIPSVKNVILVSDQNPKVKVLTFGKCGNDRFYLKAEHPLSPLIVMGYFMTSFNFKFVTQ